MKNFFPIIVIGILITSGIGTIALPYNEVEYAKTHNKRMETFLLFPGESVIPLPSLMNPLSLGENLHKPNIFNEFGILYGGMQSGWPQIYPNGEPMGGLTIDSHGDIIVTGYSLNVSTFKPDIVTIKYDSDGNELWNVTYNSGNVDIAWDIVVDSQDNIIIYGANATTMKDFQDLKIDFRVIKYNNDGIKQWNVSYHKAINSFPGGITVDSSDNIIITGGIGDFEIVNISCWTMKMDEYGRELWNNTFLEDMANMGYDVAVDSNDDIIVGGFFAAFFFQGFNAVKYDNNGNKIWVKRYSGGNEPRAIIVDSVDNIIFTGTNYSTVTESITWYTIKCANTGELLWKKEYDSGYHDGASNIAVDSQNNIITVGYSSFSEENNLEYCTIIYDKDGKEICMKRPGIYGSIYGVAVDSSDAIFITGNMRGNYYTDKFVDVTPPIAHVEKPSERTLYIFDRKIVSLPRNTVIVGQITVEVFAEDSTDIEKVEFYVDNILEITRDELPYEWIWDELSFGTYRLITMVYDGGGSIARNEIVVWRFF